MRYLSLPCMLALILVLVAGCSEEAAPTSALDDAPLETTTATLSHNRVVHHASLGGADICEALGLPTGCDANFSLTANMKADGSVKGQWQDTFAGGGEGIHVSIDCLNVVGNGAVVGGVVTNGTIGGVDATGQRALTAVVDNGTSKNDPADQLSVSFTGIDIPCTDLEPAAFPLFELTNGQVKVY